MKRALVSAFKSAVGKHCCGSLQVVVEEAEADGRGFRTRSPQVSARLVARVVTLRCAAVGEVNVSHTLVLQVATRKRVVSRGRTTVTQWSLAV